MIKSALKQIVYPVEERLKAIFDDRNISPVIKMFSACTDSMLLDQVRDLTLRGGKRMRAALVIQGAALFNSNTSNAKAIIEAAAALEIFHSYLLIHDDIMDKDDVRRGGVSVHAALAQKTGDNGLGISLGILAGDLASAFSQLIMSSIDVEAERKIKTMEIFARMHIDVVYGQTLDVQKTASAVEIATHKTASYTASGPLMIGAALAGAATCEIECLGEIARPLGIAFQISDDLLGTFGVSEITGKPADKDLRTGKRTFLLEEALNRADCRQKAAIEAVVKNDDATDDEVQTARNALIECGAKDSCKATIRGLVDKFKIDIKNGGFIPEAADFLVDLAGYVESRDR